MTQLLYHVIGQEGTAAIVSDLPEQYFERAKELFYFDLTAGAQVISMKPDVLFLHRGSAYVVEIKMHAPLNPVIWELKNARATVRLKRPIEVVVTRDGDLYFVENLNLNIIGHGFTREEAISDFKDYFIDDYLSYNSADAEKLTEDAKELLKKYRSFIGEVRILEGKKQS